MDGKTPVKGLALVADHDIPKSEIKKRAQQCARHQNGNQPPVEDQGKDDNDRQDPKPQLGVEILLPVEFRAPADSAPAERTLAVQFAVSLGLPSLRAML